MAAETSQTLDRGLRVLEVVADSADGLTVTELAAALGIGRTVVYRLVVTLEQHALLRRSADGCCRLGLGILAMGRQVQPVVRDTALPALRLLADAVGATAILTVVVLGIFIALIAVDVFVVQELKVWEQSKDLLVELLPVGNWAVAQIENSQIRERCL